MGIQQDKKRNLSRREVLKYGVYGSLTSGLSSSLWLSGCNKRQDIHKPNVVLILIDSLRPDYLNFYGYKKETSAFLSKLVKNSFLFTRAFSTSSWTAPATASLFTSKYPYQHGVVEGYFANLLRVKELKKTGESKIMLNKIPTSLRTLPDVFKSLGYSTYGISANINIGEKIGFHRGFDLFLYNTHATADMIYEQIGKLKKTLDKSKPFFLYLHANDVHFPYRKRMSYYQKQDDPQEDFREMYLSEIGFTDEYLRKIYETLNLADNTIVMVISDHGEEFWDHGGTFHDSTLYRELTQVVMLLQVPFSKSGLSRINVNVSLIDVLPTLVELVSNEAMQNVEGVSLKPLLVNNSTKRKLGEQLHQRVLFTQRIMDSTTGRYRNDYWSEDRPERQHWGAIYQNWNMIEWGDSRKELFDHSKDFQEKHNLFSKYPEVASSLLSKLQILKKSKPEEAAEKAEINLDEKLLEELKSLGYVE
ncbi:MAG: sulfatase [Planctomycetota bacterium]|jgi:arylsulfatase A-like enzyme